MAFKPLHPFFCELRLKTIINDNLILNLIEGRHINYISEVLLHVLNVINKVCTLCCVLKDIDAVIFRAQRVMNNRFLQFNFNLKLSLDE